MVDNGEYWIIYIMVKNDWELLIMANDAWQICNLQKRWNDSSLAMQQEPIYWRYGGTYHIQGLCNKDISPKSDNEMAIE